MTYSPLLITTFGMFWVEIFYLFGRGGYTIDKELHIADQPWQIVMPALVSFGIVTLYEMGHVFMLHKYLRLLCGQLKGFLHEYQDEDCGYLFALYGTTPQESIFPNYLNYSIVAHSSLWVMVTCLLATIIMIIRVFRGADFEITIQKSSWIRRRKVSQKVPRLSVMNTSKENMIFIDRNFVSSRSVHFE